VNPDTFDPTLYTVSLIYRYELKLNKGENHEL